MENTLLFKILGQVSFFKKKETNTFIQQGHIKLINCEGKDIYNLLKDY